eukprot:TRINITY_DN553_c0_g6_i4.p1 TRINITY_DN553_c0_g6~~TRINITY_DN553_c0_g6_i4.p1  ORF type:complete len:293 (+),score=53.66 TRINITY_DN553_c0_g6_i4:747-1625(+)
MKVVIQRVKSASVTVDGVVISQIGRGLLVLVGICKDDSEEDADYICKKVLGARLFEDETGKHWSKSAKDKGLEILFVSQFTLYAYLNGNKPDFHLAMGSEVSRTFYENFLQKVTSQYDKAKIKDGQFGAMMDVGLVNEGPVTLLLDSAQRGPPPSPTPTQQNSDKGKKKPAQKGATTPTTTTTITTATATATTTATITTTTTTATTATTATTPTTPESVSKGKVSSQSTHVNYFPINLQSQSQILRSHRAGACLKHHPPRLHNVCQPKRHFVHLCFSLHWRSPLYFMKAIIW